MRFQMTLRDRRVRAEIAFETLLALVSLLVNLKKRDTKLSQDFTSVITKRNSHPQSDNHIKL